MDSPTKPTSRRYPDQYLRVDKGYCFFVARDQIKAKVEETLVSIQENLFERAKALRENGRAMDPTSAGNLLTLGLDADDEMRPPDAAGVGDW